MFRFSIRELMLVTLVVALGVGWWLDRRNDAGNNALWRARAGTLEELLKGKGYRVSWVADTNRVILWNGHIGAATEVGHNEPSPDTNWKPRPVKP
jgi:hypothetical protein